MGEEFEAISGTSFSSNTFSPTYSNGGLILMSGNPIKTDGVAVTLTLKVKAGITSKSSTISFENIVASAGSNTGDIAVGTKTITIKANETATGDGNGSGTESNGGTTQPSDEQQGAGTTDKQGNSQKTNTTKNTTNSQAVKPKQLPKAGNAESIIIITLILIVAVVAIVSFIKYKK